MTLNPKEYPILSKASELSTKARLEFCESLSQEEKMQAAREAERLGKALNSVARIFALALADAIRPCMIAIANWWESLPQEAKEQLIDKGVKHVH